MNAIHCLLNKNMKNSVKYNIVIKEKKCTLTCISNILDMTNNKNYT